MIRAPHRILRSAAASVLVATALTGCSVVDGSRQLVDDAIAETPSSAPVTDAPTAPWGYAGAIGPDAWGALSDSYADCAIGTSQSPVNLPPSGEGEAARAVVEIEEPVAAGLATDTGHTGEFEPDHDAMAVSYGGTSYSLDQMHFHVPAEHTVDGKPFAAEFHFVHGSEDGGLLVLALLAEEGPASPAFEPFIEDATAGTETKTAVDLSALLPTESAVWAYEGSLTTPPCSEGVQWIVLQDTVTLADYQIERLADLHGENARPVQPLSDRTVGGGVATIER